MLFTLLKYRKAVAIGLAILAVVAVAGIVYRKGVVAERARIERQNNAAIEQARKGARNVDECYASGGLWSAASGECWRPEPGR